jgi:DHA2 family multidrug resistance protein
VGALQIVLDKGQEDDWFGSHFIITLIVVAVVGLVPLVIWEWFQKEPVVDVRLFKNFNFAISSLMFLMLGMALFSSTVLMPQLLQTLMGYTAQKAGMVLSAGALVVLVVLPMVGRLTSRFQARHLIASGWITLAVSMYVSCKQIDLLMSFNSATLLRAWQYIPVAFLFVPLTLAGYVGLSPEKTNAAAGLMNFMRNIGQSVGTSAVTTLIARRSQYHQSVLAEYTGSGSLPRSYRRFNDAAYPCGTECPRSATTSTGSHVRIAASAGRGGLLRRDVWADFDDVGNHVCLFISAEGKRAGKSWQSLGPLAFK